MFGFIKNLWHKPAAAPAEYPEPEPAIYGEDLTPPPLRQQTLPARKNLLHQNGRGLDLPLEKILETLPLELQPRIRQREVGGLLVPVPLEKILAQLSRGTVRISFGDLRQAAPGIFTPEPDKDSTMVPLPLAEILSKLNPALITRRRVQRKVEVPSEINSPFGEDGQGLSFCTEPPLQAESKPGTSFTRAPARTPGLNPPLPGTPGRTNLTHSATPPPATLPEPSRAPLPFARTRESGQQAPRVPQPSPIPFAPPKPVAPPPPPLIPMIDLGAPSAQAPAPLEEPQPPEPQQFQPRQSQPRQSQPQEFEAPASQPPPAAMPQPGPAVPAPAERSDVHDEFLVVGVTALAEGWPDEVRREIVERGLVELEVALPVRTIEQGLKHGRVSVTWKTLHAWIKPAVPQWSSPADGVVLELPLKVVAPSFLARQQQQASKNKRVTVDADIPNLFFGFPQPEPTPLATAAATATPGDTNYYVWADGSEKVQDDESTHKKGATFGTRFVEKYATPNEVVSRAAALEGVVGVLIALPDGLMVASQLPPDINGDTLAAFLPQIFGKVSACTRELRMGDLNNLNFTVGNVPWKIFRVNAIFFAAFGRAGQPLPTNKLAALAAELDHKPK